MVKHVGGLYSLRATLFVTKYEIDPVVQLTRYQIRFQSLTVKVRERDNKKRVEHSYQQNILSVPLYLSLPLYRARSFRLNGVWSIIFRLTPNRNQGLWPFSHEMSRIHSLFLTV